MVQKLTVGTVTFWEQTGGGDLHRKIGSVPAEYADEVRQLIARLEAQGDGGARGEPVRVIEIDEKVFEEERRRNPRIQTVQVNQLFPSAKHASDAMAYAQNDVATQLSKEKNKRIREVEQKYGVESLRTIRLRPSATLRGVTFQYEKDVPD
jgi:hypothetical protein